VERTIQLEPIGEGETGLIFGSLREPDGSTNGIPLPGTTVGLTLKVTGINEDTGEVLNGRLDQDVLNVNGGTVDALGNFVLELGPLDTARVSYKHRLERHIYTFVWTWPGPNGTRVGRHIFIFPITEYPVAAP